MRTWQDAIHRRTGRKQPGNSWRCRIHGQGAIRRLQCRPSARHGREVPASAMNVLIMSCSASNSLPCLVVAVVIVCQCSCADAAAVSTSGNTQPPPKPTQPAPPSTQPPATTPPPAQTTPPRRGAAASDAAVTRGDCTFRDRGVLSDLPGGSVPGVVRRRARSAVLHLRSHGAVCRRGDVTTARNLTRKARSSSRNRRRTCSRSAASAKSRWRFRRESP